MSLIAFPNIPDVPGVPNIPRNGSNALGLVAGVANTAANVLLLFKTLTQVRIGIYEKATGLSVPRVDGSCIDFTVSADNVVPTYPVEDGSWMNYNVVVMPIKISAKILYAPTLGSSLSIAGLSLSEVTYNNPKALQGVVINTLDTIRKNPFPLLWYDGDTWLGDFQLTKFSTSIDSKFGPTAIIVNVELTEIMSVQSTVSTQSITAHPKNPYNTPTSDGGLVQPVTKTTAQAVKIIGGN